MTKKVFIVCITSGLPYEDFDWWIQGVFSSKEKAIQCVRDYYEIPEEVSFEEIESKSSFYYVDDEDIYYFSIKEYDIV